MAKRSKLSPQEPQKYRVTHRLYRFKKVYNSWIELCEETTRIAEIETERRLSAQMGKLGADPGKEFDAMFNLISDEMISTAEELDES